jgi:hypothetical protein
MLTIVIAAVCLAGIAFNIRFFVALCVECKVISKQEATQEYKKTMARAA